MEAVIMRYDTRLGMCGGKPRPGGIRSTLCISSQVLIDFLYYAVSCHLGSLNHHCAVIRTFDIYKYVFINRLVAKWVAHSVLLVVWDSKAI